MRTILLLGALVGGVALLGCERAWSSEIRGPDGRRGWLLITCRQSHGECLEEAADECKHGYEVANDVAHRRGGEMLIRCRGKEERDEEINERMAPASGPSPLVPARDLSMCMKAEAHSSDAAAIWAARTPNRSLRDAPPPHDAFVNVCASLEEPVQICLNASYANKHEAACAGAFDSMSDRDRRRVDGLFFHE